MTICERFRRWWCDQMHPSSAMVHEGHGVYVCRICWLRRDAPWATVAAAEPSSPVAVRPARLGRGPSALSRWAARRFGPSLAGTAGASAGELPAGVPAGSAEALGGRPSAGLLRVAASPGHLDLAPLLAAAGTRHLNSLDSGSGSEARIEGRKPEVSGGRRKTQAGKIQAARPRM